MCISNVEYQYVNPTTQVSLFSVWLENCPSLQNITWNIYTSSSNSSQWNLFNQTNQYSLFSDHQADMIKN